MSGKRSYAEAIRRLDAAQKPGRAVPPYTRYVNRWLGRRLAAACYVWGRTPNQVTWLSLLASALGIALFAVGPIGWATGVAAAALFILGFALDSADGQLARLTGGGGLAGEWFDHTADAGREPAIQLGLLVYLYRAGAPTWSWLLPMAVLVFTTARFMAQVLADQLRRGQGDGAADGLAWDSGSDAQAARRALLQTPSDPGTIFLSFILLGALEVFVVVYSLIAAANVLLATASFRRRHRELVGLARKVR